MMTLRDVMTPDPITVSPATPLKEVARLLVENRVSGLPVIDEERRVLGVVSEADLLVKEHGRDAIDHRRFSRFIGESATSRAKLAKLEAATAGEAMTTPAITVGPTYTIGGAASLMARRAVNRLPVVDEAGRLLGIVSRADLVRAFVRSDEGLAATIREDILYRALWLNPVLFDVTVTDGIVRVAGRVERHSTADAVEHAISMVPGVVGVVSDVTWDAEDDSVEAPGRDLVSPYRVI